MRPRIFSLMLIAFGLVIFLGVGGMIGFFGLAVANFEHSQGQWMMPAMMARSEARRLGDYYARSGSWEGVEDRFDRLESELTWADGKLVTVVDDQGVVVASNDPLRIPVGRPYLADRAVQIERPDAPVAPAQPASSGTTEGTLVQTVPITYRGRQVGSLVMIAANTSSDETASASFDGRRVIQGFASAGLALAAILLTLAAIFSGRISNPLRQLTRASQSLAGGDMSVRVKPSIVREVNELSNAFNGMAEALVLADQQRRQLTADVAHELRTPLSIIKGRLEGIQDGVYTASTEQIDGLLGEVALLERLIDDLRLLALADAGQLPLYPESIDPTPLLYDTRRSFAHHAEERDISLIVEPPHALPEIQIDPQRISQVLGNLVDNALRHTPAGGSVTIAATMADSQAEPAIVFRISDTGTGIQAEDLPRIFDRFYRADRSRTRASGGAGLGLAIARRIVEAHGGTIWAESTPGQGTTIMFRLPVTA